LKHDIFPQLRNIVADHLRIRPAEVTLPASFRDDLQADSLDAMEMIIDFEEAFGVVISDTEVDMILTVQDAVDHITAKMEPSSP
jgi:acyl carrier protein